MKGAMEEMERDREVEVNNNTHDSLEAAAIGKYHTIQNTEHWHVWAADTGEYKVLVKL